jgi:hypothetical protein
MVIDLLRHDYDIYDREIQESTETSLDVFGVGKANYGNVEILDWWRREALLKRGKNQAAV